MSIWRTCPKPRDAMLLFAGTRMTSDGLDITEMWRGLIPFRRVRRFRGDRTVSETWMKLGRRMDEG